MSHVKSKTMKSKIESSKFFRNIAWIGMLGLLFIALSCSDDDTEPAARIQLKSSSTLGNYLADVDGNTLYYFSNDAAGENTCTGACATAWPIYFEANLTADMLGDGLSIDDFSSVSSASGQQTTYKGWPLYYYAPGGVREPANVTTGEGVGDIWFVAKPDYTIMLTNSQLVGMDGKSYKGDYTEGTGNVLYFVDGEGRTLYSFDFDKKNDNNYTNGDNAHDAVWPIFAQTLASVPSILDKTLFGTIDVSGQKQLTYKGWPLYYYGSDTERGDNKGVSVPTPGIWPVVTENVDSAPE
jgi:predicted lipoprotein with Yx(FWY)xxD motif